MIDADLCMAYTLPHDYMIGYSNGKRATFVNCQVIELERKLR